MTAFAETQTQRFRGRSTHLLPAPVAQLVGCVLVFVFLLEQWFPIDQGMGLIPSARTMISFGSLEPPLIKQGEWWRLLICVFLHGGPGHLIEDLISLVGIGAVLEPLLGKIRFSATLAFGAMASALCSYWWLPADAETFGSSGAVMSVLAANFVYSFHFPDWKRRGRLMLASGGYLIPMLVGTFNGFHGNGLAVDYGSHIGGPIAGACFGLLLLFTAPNDTEKSNSPIAAAFLAVYLAACSFGLVATILHYHRYAVIYADMIPVREFPGTGQAGAEKSAYFVTRFPNDPQSHLFRGEYYLENKRYVDAEWEFLIAQSLAHGPLMTDEYRNVVDGFLAVALSLEGRRNDAMAAAKKVCRAPSGPGQLQSVQFYLLTHGLCS
jgi:rhomboid protease GluP